MARAAARRKAALPDTGKQHTYSTGLNYDRAFSSTLLTEARIGVAHYGNSALTSDYGTDYATQSGDSRREHQPVHQRLGRHQPGQ
ncbi:MAG: hypothetical protein QM757_39125 [Paludibaculum sp.]